MKRLLLLLTLGSFLACVGGKDDEEEEVDDDEWDGWNDDSGETDDSAEDSPSDSGDDSGEPDTGACEGTAPVIVSAFFEEYGTYEFEDGPAPGVAVSAETTDVDGDLHEITITLHWDDVVDGAVSSSAEGLEVGPWELSGVEACEASEATVGLLLEVGNHLDYDTEYEFSVEVTDAAGLTSNTELTTGTTPAAD